MSRLLRTMAIFVLWFTIGTFGLIISFVWNIWWGAAFTAVCYLIWLEAERVIENWWEGL